jgi:hypothetical protein
MKTVKITAFRLNKDNPRLIRDGKFRSLVDSIKRDPEFLEKRGIVHADGVILGGNQRYLAIKEALRDDTFRSSLSLDKGLIPASWVQDASDWPEEKRRRFVIIDNGSFGEWDFDALGNFFDDLPLKDFGINIPVDWTKPKEFENEGLMAKNFNEGKGVEEGEHPERTGSNQERFPVTFILDQSEWEAWVMVKDGLKLRDDKAAFLKLIGGKANA